MNLLDRYIFKSVLGTCLAAVGLLTFVFTVPNVVRELLSPLLAGQIEFAAFARLVGLIVPYAAVYALPAGILTGVLLTLGRLSADAEITAMRAAGVSLSRVARPIFLLGAACAALALYINFEWMPLSRMQYQRAFAAAIQSNPLHAIVPRTFIRDFKGWVIYVGDRRGTELRDIWVWVLDDQNRVRRVVRAEAGEIRYDEETNSLIPTLIRAKSEERDSDNPEDFSKSPKAFSVERSEELRFSLDRFTGQSVVRRAKPDWLTYGQLQAERARRAAERPPPEQRAEHARSEMKFALVLHNKFNLSLAVFSFALIGVPLGIKVSRRETSANFGVAVILILGYYVLGEAIKALDRHPELRPDLLLWLPNLLFLALGGWLFSRIDRR